MIASDAALETEAAPPSYPALWLALKRLLDLVIAIPAAILVLPLIALAVLAIKLVDPGPGFFIQKRQGMDGRTFNFLKLRTMRWKSDAWLREYLRENPEAKDPRIYRNARDPRILPGIGVWLRRYSIDELPQIWNVVRGDLSLVGPRALPEYHCELLSPEFRTFRSRVRPGITGLWQIEGRKNADPTTIEIYDRTYLTEWSLGADLVLLVRTVRCVLSGSGI